MLGVGFSTTEKSCSGSIAQNNIFGSGKNVAPSSIRARSTKSSPFPTPIPYFTIDGISQGWDVHHRGLVNPTSLTVGNYKTASTGGGLRFGFPSRKKEAIVLGVGIDSRLRPSPTAPNATSISSASSARPICRFL